jgi:hypothetical protein
MSKISPISRPEPLSSLSESRVLAANSAAEQGSSEQSAHQRLRELEARMAVLETAIMEHALVLRDRIGKRLDRLEQKFHYEADGLRRALKDESSDRHEKIIQLTESFTSAVDRVESKQPASDVHSTLQDLIAALAATRTHLDVLAQAVADKRQGLAS